MTVIQKTLSLLREPMSVDMLGQKLGKSSKAAQDAVSALRKAGCVEVHHTVWRKGRPGQKFWIATGRPYCGRAFCDREPKPRALPHRKRSGIIAPRPYAYGLLW